MKWSAKLLLGTAALSTVRIAPGGQQPGGEGAAPPQQYRSVVKVDPREHELVRIVQLAPTRPRVGAAIVKQALGRADSSSSGSTGGVISNVSLGPFTAHQQVISFTLPSGSDLSGCTVVVYSDAARTQPVPDSDPSINPHAQNCSRGALSGDLSSIVNETSDGVNVQFVSGLRGVRKGATDGQLHSMSLSPLTTYYYAIRTSAASVQGEFTTDNIPVGQAFPEVPAPDMTGTNINGLAYPAIGDGTNPIADPTTGLLIRLILPVRRDISGVQALNRPAIDLSSGKWSGLANCGTNGASFCSSAGAGSSDVLFVPLPVIPNLYYGSPLSGWGPGVSIDDIVFFVYCGSEQSQQTLRISLTRDSGVTPASGAFDVACPVGSASLQAMLSDAVHVHPSFFFSGWSPLPQWIKPEISPAQAVVNISGTSVEWVSGDLFVTSVPPNSYISIGGEYYQISHFIDTKHLVLTAPAGAQTGVQATMAATGLRIVNLTGTGTVSLSVGARYAESTQAGFSAPPQFSCSLNTIPIITDASGNAMPSVPGYLCSDGQSIYLSVLHNGDGSPREEMRPLSAGFADAAGVVNTNGDPDIRGLAPSAIVGGWDPSDPLSYFALVQSAGAHIYKVSYTPSLKNGACAGFPAYAYGPNNGYVDDSAGVKNRDCFTWTNLTPSSSVPSKELLAQIQAAWATGRNMSGEQVSPAHAIMPDIGWMRNLNFLNVIGSTGCVQVTGGGQDTFGLSGCFNLSTGILQSMADSFSSWPAIGAGAHSWNVFPTPGAGWGTLIAVPITGGNPLVPFNRPFQATVTAVNRAGFGSAAVWDTNTRISGADFYECPPFTDAKMTTSFAQWSGTQNCLEVKLSSAFCNHTPAPNASMGGYDFADGQSETEAFPCSTPGFGVPVGATSWSKLWDIFPGMWLSDLSSGDYFGESFVVAAAPAYTAADEVELWLLRTPKDKIIAPLNAAVDPAGCVEAAAGKTIHSPFSTLAVTVPFNCGSGVAYWNTNDPTGTMYADNPYNSVAHGTSGSGLLPGTFTHITASNGSRYGVAANLPLHRPPGGMIGAPLQPGPPLHAQFSGYAGAAEWYQSYANLTAATPLATPSDRKMLDTHAMNPAYGAAAEYAGSCLASGLTLILQSGTAQTWQINDPASAGAFDPHLSTSSAFAGSHWLRDYSGPATGNVVGDAQSYGYCRPYRSNECRAGSAPGDIFVSVPFAENPNQCVQTNQNGMAVPAVFNTAPLAGQAVQLDQTASDPSGALYRKLGFALRAPGMQYTYAETEATPDGRAIVGRIDWADGRFGGLYIAAIPPWPSNAVAGVSSGYYTTPVNVPPGNAPFARVIFGYAENGSAPGNLYCTSRAEVCAAGGDPFVFVQSDASALQSCRTGCTVNVPLIRGRIAFVQAQWLSSNGAVVSSGPLQTMATPPTCGAPCNP